MNTKETMEMEGTMARPEKRDADYFPFYAKRGKTLNILQSKFGLEGIGFFTNMMRFLTLTPDHHYCIKDETDRMNFFAEIGLHDESRGIEMIELMVKTGKLDRELWNNHMVIVSEAFLLSIEDAYKRRNNKIITIDEIRKKFVSVAENSVIVYDNPTETDNNPAQAYNNPQSKVKKSKVKKIISDSGESPTPKRIALLDREPKNDMERVNKKWLENYIALYGTQPINPRWDLTSPLVSKALKIVGIEKLLLAIDTAMKDKFCLESGYMLKIIMSGNVISRLVNKYIPPKHGIAADNIPPEKAADYFREG